jgi:DNA phosphorothioation-dependent restriction protein DptH
MGCTDLHARVLALAFEKVLGRASRGSMAFVRCLTPEVVEGLAVNRSFAPRDWQVWRVADTNAESVRTITADRAVEMREAKADAVLLLVDTLRAGAGMDGIHSAAREVDDPSLFAEALRLAGREVTRQLSSSHRQYAENAVKRARTYGRRFSISLWTEFDFLCRIAGDRKHPGEYLHLLGLWPVQEPAVPEETDGLDVSRLFVDRLLTSAVSGLTPARRIEGLRLLGASAQQVADLEGFLRSAATKSLLPALADLIDKRHLWVNALRIEGSAQAIQSIELSSWRTNTGRTATRSYSQTGR